MGNPSLQHVVWHRGGFFLASPLQCFLHFFMDFGGFALHFLTILAILHFFLSARPGQLVSGGGADAGADGGGSGLHKPQVSLHFSFFAGLYFLHFFGMHFLSVSAQSNGIGGDGEGDGGG